MPGRAEDMRKIGEALATMKRIHNVMPIPLDRIEIFDEEYRPSFDKGLIECDDYLEDHLLNRLRGPFDVKGEPVCFSAFIDGVQRIAKVAVVPRYGTPIFIAQIAAGVLAREGKTLKIPSDVERPVFSKLLIIAPFEGLEYEGFEGLKEDLMSILGDGAIEDYDFVEHLMDEEKRFLLCDITFPSIDKNRRESFRCMEDDTLDRACRPILGDELYNIGYIIMRARGRVATLRQILEVAALMEYRKAYEDEYVLVDGPLIYTEKWTRRLRRELGGKSLGDLLRNAVGYVKTLRAKPSSILLKDAIRLREGERTKAFILSREVDGLGEKGDYMAYEVPHISWYMRIRNIYRTEDVPTLYGLVRIDTYVTTYGCDRIKELKEARDPGEVISVIERLSAAVLAERYPLPSSRYRKDVMLMPIEEVEKCLRGFLYDNHEVRFFIRKMLMG